MASCRTQESKKKAKRTIDCMFLGRMMICGTDFVDEEVKLGRGMNESSFWWF